MELRTDVGFAAMCYSAALQWKMENVPLRCYSFCLPLFYRKLLNNVLWVMNEPLVTIENVFGGISFMTEETEG